METINFKDIFKSSILEKTSSFSIIDSMIGLVVAFAIGLFIYYIYKKTFTGVIYSHTFNISLIIMSMATALIIIGISSNVLLSLGMVGALSIVRFRTPIKDPMDIVYIFWAIVSGILCGAGFIPLVIGEAGGRFSCFQINFHVKLFIAGVILAYSLITLIILQPCNRMTNQ